MPLSLLSFVTSSQASAVHPPYGFTRRCELVRQYHFFCAVRVDDRHGVCRLGDRLHEERVPVRIRVVGENRDRDDGSDDGSWEIIRQLGSQDPKVRGIRFRRRFGKATALNAGFRAAQGDVIVTLDADLQDDPREIAKLLEKMNEGYDVVSGWKQVRHDPKRRVFASRVFNWLVSRLV